MVDYRKYGDGVIASIMHFAGGAWLRPYRPASQEVEHHNKRVKRAWGWFVASVRHFAGGAQLYGRSAAHAPTADLRRKF